MVQGNAVGSGQSLIELQHTVCGNYSQLCFQPTTNVHCCREGATDFELGGKFTQRIIVSLLSSRIRFSLILFARLMPHC